MNTNKKLRSPYNISPTITFEKGCRSLATRMIIFEKNNLTKKKIKKNVFCWFYLCKFFFAAIRDNVT